MNYPLLLKLASWQKKWPSHIFLYADQVEYPMKSNIYSTRYQDTLQTERHNCTIFYFLYKHDEKES